VTTHPTGDPGLETRIATLDLLDHAGVNWPAVQSLAYLIHQQFRYDYDGPIQDLRQRLVIVPPERHGDQRLVTHRLEVSAPAARKTRETDRFGNQAISLRVDDVAETIAFTAWIVVERTQDGTYPEVTPGQHRSAEFREPSRLTEPDDALRAAAVSLTADAAGPEALARRINAFTHGHMRYAHGVTGVGTTAAEAFALGEGVCQDSAHIMLALCRLCGVPARYVSGHMLGEGGTHAWVEALLPDPARPGRFHARPFDPTHGTEPGLRYLTIATGRDYSDVAPTSGTYTAPHAGTLSAMKRAGLTAVTYATG